MAVFPEMLTIGYKKSSLKYKVERKGSRKSQRKSINQIQIISRMI